MKEIIIVFYLLVIFVTSMYLFEKYYVAKKTTEEVLQHSWYDEAARRYGAEYIASILEGEE